MYQVDKIKFILGDCLNIEPIDNVGLIITDPPYYVIPKGKTTTKGKDNFTWDNFESKEVFLDFTKKWFEKYYDMLNGNSFMYIFWSQKYLLEGLNIFKPSRTILWHYKNLVLGGNGDFAYDYEPIFVVKKGNPKLKPGKHSSILEFTKPQSNFKKDKLIHPTQKPLELIKHLISISDFKGKVLDPFGGSGTTSLASTILGYESVYIEKEISYYNLASYRILNYERI